MTAWDFARQQSETADTIEDLKTNQNVPVGPKTIVTLDIFLMPQEGADEEALERALAMFGYTGDPGETEDKEPVYVVSVADVALTAEDIWLHEERVTKIAVARGYAPDGWGFFEPE